MDFNVDLNIFRGPLDLLLYLVRKHEVEIVDIPIATITDQYLEYLAVLEQFDVNAVGDFLAMASLLIEIKSQQVLPRSDEVEEELDDPRQELVRRLLEYKKYRDAASMLEERSRSWQQHYPRLSTDLPPHEREPGRASRSRRSSCGTWSARSAASCARPTPRRPSSIVYDDTPIHVYMSRIHARLLERGPARLPRPVRAGHAQIDAGRHLPGRPGAGAPSPRPRRAERRCSAKSGSCPTRRHDAAGSVGRRRVRTRREVGDSLHESARAESSLPTSATILPLTTMINNLPVKTLTHKDLTIEGYSRAAVQTYWRIPELKLGFDLGAQPWSFMGTPTWFVSHTHMDHIDRPAGLRGAAADDEDGAADDLPARGGHRADASGCCGCSAGWTAGGCRASCCRRRPGDEIELSREQVVTVSATTHTVPSLGFVVWERRRKLKPEFQGLPGDQIRDLRLGGTEVTAEVRIPRVAYLGDSSPGRARRLPGHVSRPKC